MEYFFAANFSGPGFVLFGTAHMAALGVIILICLGLSKFRNARHDTRRGVRWLLAAILILNEIAWHLWNVWVGRWTIQTMLPLQLCSLMVWSSALMLITNSYSVYEFCYFLGIGGALQGVLTPDLGIYGFPHFRFFQTFISHGLIIAAAITMTIVEEFRPTWKSLGRVAISTNLYVVCIFGLNSLIDSDYLMLNGKPATPSLLDLLPPWPTYIIYMELIGLATCLLLYLPFFLKDRQAKTRRASTMQ